MHCRLSLIPTLGLYRYLGNLKFHIPVPWIRAIPAGMTCSEILGHNNEHWQWERCNIFVFFVSFVDKNLPTLQPVNNPAGLQGMGYPPFQGLPPKRRVDALAFPVFRIHLPVEFRVENTHVG